MDGKDYCTLVTCTPYAINSHRLLVRGERTEYTGEEKSETKESDAVWRTHEANSGCVAVDAWALAGSRYTGDCDFYYNCEAQKRREERVIYEGL